MADEWRSLVTNEYIQRYLGYVEDTESPRLFHAWAALSGISACLKRKVWMPFGPFKIYPNMFVFLVGAPGVKKSSAISIMTKLLEDYSDVRFGPSDTAGQRQGLLAALRNSDDEEEQQELEEQLKAMTTFDVESLGNVELNLQSPAEKHALYVASEELTSFLGVKSLELITCIGDLWDNKSVYEYRLKNSLFKVDQPTLSLIGGTTPTNISTAFPQEAIGQGFMSRTIMVHGADRYKSIPRPKELPGDLRMWLGTAMQQACNFAPGPVVETEEAGEYIDALYEYSPRINDARFVHYSERRQQHKLKVALCLAVARGSTRIELCDVQDAHALLTETERHMARALGEYGLSALSIAKQRIVEFVEHSKQRVTSEMIRKQLLRDIKTTDFATAMSDLTEGGVLVELQDGKTHQTYYRRVAEKSNVTLQDLMRLQRVTNPVE